MRTETVRHQVQDFLRAVPFKPFALTLENGQHLLVGHPENMAFMPDRNGTPGSLDFFVRTEDLRVHSTFDAVTSVALMADRGAP